MTSPTGRSTDQDHAPFDRAPFDCDLFVIGAGSGGTRAARVAAQHGARVAIAEAYRFGGTCVIRGCVPKKLMVYASRFRDAFDGAAGYGWTLPQAPHFDWHTLVSGKEREITRLSGIYLANLRRAGVAIHECRATVSGPNEVRLADGSRVTAGLILVATGGEPAIPASLPGHELAISSDDIFDLAAFPRRLAIVGSGYIGMEFASVFTRLGSRVTLVNRGAKVLRGFDEDMRDGVQSALAAAGVRFIMEAQPERIERRDGALALVLRSGEAIAADQVLLATGRHPSTKGLGLEAAGVEMGAKGEVCVDAASRSSVPSIYAVGDVTDRVALTPVAIREGQAFADTQFGGLDCSFDHATIATAVFTTPEIGTVGLTEEEAKARHPCVDVYAASFKPMYAALAGRDEQVIMKLIVDGRSDVVLGVHVLGEGAGEMAQLFGIAVKAGLTKRDFDRTCAVHPTLAEELVTMRTRRVRHERMGDEPTGPGMADSCS